jgi:GNAT superfamily N-acetyltransferase
MDTILRAATRQDLEEVMVWLKNEDRNEGTGFWCNRNVIQDAFIEGTLDVAVVDGHPGAFLAYGLTYSGILETGPQFRGRGLAKQLVARALTIAREHDGRCVLEFQCAPETSAPFWQHMGFKIFEQHGNTYGQMTLERSLPVPAGEMVSVLIERHWDPSQHSPSVHPASVVQPSAVRLPSGEIALGQRVIFPDGTPGFSSDRRDPVARIIVEGRQVFFDKVKREEALTLGMQQDRGGVFYLDRLVNV